MRLWSKELDGRCIEGPHEIERWSCAADPNVTSNNVFFAQSSKAMIIAHTRSSFIIKAVCIVLHVAAIVQQAAAALSLTDCVSSAAITIKYNSVYVVQEDARVVQIAYINGQNETAAIDLGGADKTALAVASCDVSTCILTGTSLQLY
jgi:hypothetical protein